MATGTIPYAPKVDVASNNSILSASLVKTQSDGIQIALNPTVNNSVAAGSIQLNFNGNKLTFRNYNGSSWTNTYEHIIEEDISSHVTPETGTTLQKAKRIGNFVLLQLVSPKITTANTYQTIATIDSGYRPAASHLYGGAVQCSSTSDFGYGFVQATSTGAVAVLYSKATSYGLQCTITYYIGS